MSARPGRSRWLFAALAAASTLPATAARADDIDAQLATIESEGRRLVTELPHPNQTPGATGARRLIDAEVSYSLGNYDTAALTLFELATRPGPDREAATFYLAEALYQKGDRGAARTYYQQVVASGNVASKYYQPALERQIEIAIAQSDVAEIGPVVAAIEGIPPTLRQPGVPYVLGKLSYAKGSYDEAIAHFQSVPRGSDVELAAAYFQATALVAKHDLARATDLFSDLIGRKPRSANDRRVIELSQLALGRLYYERDQPSKSIDSYLLVDRHSDLFPDALYEVAWVYVKNKQFDKALRALELLSLSDPQSTKTPTVRILEGNLRIRKAQMIRGALIQGTLDNRSPDDPAVEYDKAVQVFTETHDMYVPSYNALVQMAEANADPAQYLAQIAGRSSHVFQAAAPIPDAAVQYLREEPQIQRVVNVEADLGEVTTNIAETEAIIARLEGVLAVGDKTAVYPELAGRRARLALLEATVIKLRSDLADQELRLIDRSSGPLATLTASRRQVVASYARMPDPEHAAGEHLARNQAGYDALEHSVAEVDDAIGTTQAMAVAVRKYAADTPDLPVERRRAIADTLDSAAREAAAIEDGIAALRREIQVGRDLAGIGDRSMSAARTARKQVKAAEDAEHKVLAGFASGGRDPGRSRQLADQADRAARIAEQLDQAEAQIDTLVTQGLAEAKLSLGEARSLLATYKAELEDHEAQTRALGASLLTASLKDVKARFYDIVIRTDVGNVDVSWSQKEDNDDDLKRLNLSRQRELKQLKDEFRDVLDAGTQKPSAPARKPDVPRPEATAPLGSPDKGATDQRITPGGDKPSTPAAAAVKPDDGSKAGKQPAARQPSKPRGGSR
ncbi:MAG TPA: tetratricopeptide repeat protein [Kofleriaceae bacterium]|nr:tetratricopeptide repeat protein [Kofleriaceae bacterium]